MKLVGNHLQSLGSHPVNDLQENFILTLPLENSPRFEGDESCSRIGHQGTRGASDATGRTQSLWTYAVASDQESWLWMIYKPSLRYLFSTSVPEQVFVFLNPLLRAELFHSLRLVRN